MNLSYIYPEWLKAKRDLLDQIHEHANLTERQRVAISAVVLDWFEHHMFQVGASHHVSNQYGGSVQFDIKKYSLEKCASMIGQKILETGLFYESSLSGPFEEVLELRCMVFGSPKPGIKPGTRERELK